MEIAALRQNQIFRHTAQKKTGFMEERFFVKNPLTEVPNLLNKNSRSTDDQVSNILQVQGGNLSTLLSASTAVLQKHVDVVTRVQGKSCVLQGENSAVKLHVPDGVHGVILTKIHTNHAKFLNFISKSECIIGPICEYSLHKYNSHSESRTSNYKIQVPHILKNVRKIRQHIRVRHFHSHGQKRKDDLEDDFQFDIDEKYVTIHTSHFSGYIVTAEALDHCASSALALVFGSLRKIPGAEPLTSVKIFLSSLLFQIDDYRVDLVKRESLSKNPFFFLTTTEMGLSTQPYDASSSSMKINLQPSDQGIWTSFWSAQTSVKRTLHKALKYIDGHICRSNPTEFALFYMCSEGPVQYFRGLIDFEVKVDILRDDNDVTIYERSNHRVLVDIFDDAQETKPKSTTSAFTDDVAQKLSDTAVIDLARLVTTTYSLRRLAIELGIELSVIDKYIEDNHGNITEAAYSIIQVWRATQIDLKVAYLKMYKALEKAGLNDLIEILR